MLMCPFPILRWEVTFRGRWHGIRSYSGLAAKLEFEPTWCLSQLRTSEHCFKIFWSDLKQNIYISLSFSTSEVWHHLAGLSAQGLTGLKIQGLARYILIWAQVLIQAHWLWAEFNSFFHPPCGPYIRKPCQVLLILKISLTSSSATSLWPLLF